MQRCSLRLLVLVLLSAIFGGCGSSIVSLRRGPRAYTATDYETVYETWTRDDADFDWANLEDVLRVSATFESWEFRWAYLVRYAEDHSISEDEREVMLRATLADSESNHRFFVTLAGEQFRENDLTSPDSAWRVLLVDEHGRTLAPTELRRIRRPSAAEQVYFPSVSDFREAFRVVFPARREDGTPTIADSAEFVILRFTGPRGRVDLRWNMVEPD